MQKDRLWHLVSKKLAGEATAAELTELEELLRQHPEMHYAIQHIQDLWKLQPMAAPEAEDAFQKHLNKMQQKGVDISTFRSAPPMDLPPDSSHAQKKRPLARRLALAGLAFAAIISAFVFRQDIFEKKPESQQAADISEISTRNGSRSRINLPDGSIVWLNAGSKLVYGKNFGHQLREVTLMGEAYFDVVRNPDKPFIIHAGKMDIKVLGTLFNVKSYPDEKITEASLIRGSIEVSVKGRKDKVILRPNEKLIVTDDPEQVSAATTISESDEHIVALGQLSYESGDSTIIETSWVENKLIFRDESFSDLALRLERWYGVLIRFDNEEVKHIRLNGTFLKNESIRQAMEALKIAGDFNYSIDDNIIRIY